MACIWVVNSGFPSPNNITSPAGRDMTQQSKQWAAPPGPDLVLCHEQGPPGCQSFPGSMQQAVGVQDFTTAPLSGSFSPDSTLLHLSSLDSYDNAQMSKVSLLSDSAILELFCSWQTVMLNGTLADFSGYLASCKLASGPVYECWLLS